MCSSKPTYGIYEKQFLEIEHKKEIKQRILYFFFVTNFQNEINLFLLPFFHLMVGYFQGFTNLLPKLSHGWPD